MQTQGYWNMRNPETSDNILVSRALAGDQEAFEALVSRYQRSILSLIYQYIGEYHEANDVLQQVWLQLYRSLPTLHQNVHMKPWLFMVARSRSLDFLRRKRFPSFSEVEMGNEKDETSCIDAIPDTSPSPEELGELRDLQREIQRAIHTLPTAYRSIVLLYYREQMNYAEIARALNMPASTVKTRFQRAKPFLRAELTAP